MKNILRVALLSALVALAACSSTKLPPTTPTATDQSTSNVNTGTGVTTVTAGNGTELNPNIKRSIYFDFDSFVVKDEYRSVVEQNAVFLKQNKTRRVVLQGNTDERGGSEYNLALGQKRAEAVRRTLALLGVPDSQMEAVSFGKEKPKALGHDEASWAENRRVDIVYQ